MVQGQLDTHMHKKGVRVLSHIMLKTTQWIKDLSVGAKMIKPLEEITGINIHSFRLGNDFLFVTQKHKQQKTK